MYSCSSNYYDGWNTASIGTSVTSLLQGFILDNGTQSTAVNSELCADTKDDKIRLLKVTKLLTVQHL